jgi:hypothetical protein
MSLDPNGAAEFERQLHALLEESVQRVGGRARSRLNQARHAALAEAERPRRWLPRRWLAARIRWPLLWVPAAGGLAAALLVAFVLWPHAPGRSLPVGTSRASADDLELLADHDGMELMQNGDAQFYEWAMAQAAASAPPSGSGAAGQGNTRGADSETDISRNSG